MLCQAANKENTDVTHPRTSGQLLENSAPVGFTFSLEEFFTCKFNFFPSVRMIFPFSRHRAMNLEKSEANFERTLILVRPSQTSMTLGISQKWKWRKRRKSNGSFAHVPRKRWSISPWFSFLFHFIHASPFPEPKWLSFQKPCDPVAIGFRVEPLAFGIFGSAIVSLPIFLLLPSFMQLIMSV